MLLNAELKNLKKLKLRVVEETDDEISIEIEEEEPHEKNRKDSGDK